MRDTWYSGKDELAGRNLFIPKSLIRYWLKITLNIIDKLDLTDVGVCNTKDVEEYNRQRAITVPVVSFYLFESGINLSLLKKFFYSM